MFTKKLYYIKRWRQQRAREPTRSRVITFRGYARLILSMVESSSLILDVGCDSGVMARMLESEGEKNLVGIELVNRFKHGKDISFLLAENTHLPFRRKAFDLIFARKFVSIRDTKESLNEFHEILKDEGKLIIEVPNVQRLKSRIYTSLGLTPLYPQKYFPHLHLASFKKILYQRNFKILRIEGDYIFIPLIGRLLSYFRLDLLTKFLGQFKPTLCMHLFGVCEKRAREHYGDT
ncbi:MAG: class I SAM-dependent methyltransferase [Candidatus Bathyarchaeota archaeon]|nr:MAG: class I SAM-dependent methyltransferase [Candidatus Bathyarchaeota archaeon]